MRLEIGGALRTPAAKPSLGKEAGITERGSAMSDYPHEATAEKLIRKWLRSNKILGSSECQTSLDEEFGPFVTIANEAGDRGLQIANCLAQRLNWDLLSGEVADLIANQHGMCHADVDATGDRCYRWLEAVFNRYIDAHNPDDSAYIPSLKRILTLAALHGNVVLIGRGAQFVLPRDCGLSVRIVAPSESNARATAMQIGMLAYQSQTQDSAPNQNPWSEGRRIFNRDNSIGDRYDIVVNAEKFVVAELVNLIADAATWIQVR